MEQHIVGAEHEFHDQAFAKRWAERFIPTPERLRLFNTILTTLKEHIPTNGSVLELGIGPGYLARHILAEMPDIHYQGIDFSMPMLDIAKERLSQYSPRVTYTQTDLIHDNWETLIPEPVDAIVSTWALHDLGSPEHIENVYKTSFFVLKNDAILLNGDFIKPEQATQVYESGRFEVSKHLDMFARAGFSNYQCIATFEQELENPTAAQNYACLMAVK
jgi:cyclopropane fatty-acyl-phospholipid synthase-like methyltransferase